MSAQENNQLVIHDSALFVWMIGAVAACVSFIFPTSTQWVNWVFVATGLLIIVFYGDLTITADRATRTLRLEYRYLLLFHHTKTIPFDDIENIRAEKTSHYTQHSSGTVYRIVATLTDGKTVPFRLIYSSGSEKTRQAARLQAFISHKAASSGHPQETGETGVVPSLDKSEAGDKQQGDCI